MGIFICAILSPSVTEAQWAPVYEESLRMAKALGLMELVSSTCHGVPLICYESAQERPHPLVDTPDLAGTRLEILTLCR